MQLIKPTKTQEKSNFNMHNKDEVQSTSRNMESESSLQKDGSVLSRLADFCGYTTAHGFGRLVEARNVFWRVFWVAACVSAMSLFIVQVHTLAKEYSRRPVQTRIDVQHEVELTFPELTLCNLNILKKNHTQNLPHLHKIIMTGIHDLEANGTSESEEEELSDEVKYAEMIQREIAQAPEDILSKMGHQFDDMIVSCRFRGSNCKSKLFRKKLWRRYWDPRYGNCFQFNSGRTQSGAPMKPRTSTKAGPTYGLYFLLNVEQSEYFGELSPDAGIRVHIGNLGNMPFPYEEGIMVAPGFNTQIAVSQTTVMRVDPFENNSCLADGASMEDNLYQLKYGVKYSEISCKLSCYARHQEFSCGCMESHFPRPNGTSVCDRFNKTEEQCLKGLFRRYKNGRLGCSHQCPPPCSENNFHQTLSTAYWPSDQREAKLIKYLQAHNHTTSKIRSNYLILQVYFKELNYMLIKQRLAYGIDSFLSDIGGNMGMWIGISALTCVELLELFIVACHHFFQKLKGKTTTTVTPFKN